MTVRQIRQRLREAINETSVCGDETLYPAAWRFGEGVGDAMTAARGDCDLAVAAEHVAQVLHVGRDLSGEAFAGVTRVRDAADLREQHARQAPMRAGGVESFALEFSESAAARDVKIESVTPEGAPAAVEIKVGEAKLGTWNATKVRVQGRGKFASVMDLVGEFGDPNLPVRLESFAFRSSGNADDGAVGFNLLLTVYEQKGGTT